MKKILNYCIFLLLFSCSSYRCVVPETLIGKSINVPYVQGDRDGRLTEAIVNQLVTAGAFSYKHFGADYSLCVRITDIQNNNIGYKKERNPDGSIRKNLMPIEGRESIFAEVALKSNLTGKSIWGPWPISADIDYDFVDQDSSKDLSFINKKGVKHTVLSYSLGQLESVACAQDSATFPLYKNLAKNIIRALIAEFKENDEGY